jgi:hypothetical protein
MNVSTHSERQALELVDIIDFKWLMAKDGLHVHVERLQNDPAYALDCLNQAAASPRAAGLRQSFDIAPGLVQALHADRLRRAQFLRKEAHAQFFQQPAVFVQPRVLRPFSSATRRSQRCSSGRNSARRAASRAGSARSLSSRSTTAFR